MRSLCAVLAGATLLAGCFTGERPSFGSVPVAGVQTGDEHIDAVLALLDAVPSAVFTSQYDVTVRFGGTSTGVTATQATVDRRSVTIGDVRYITDATGARTCTVSSGSCAPGTNLQPISDTGLTADFLFGDMAVRLRRFAGSRIGTTTSVQSTIAGQTATCVDLPLANGTATYCALANGVLARVIDGDITIEMTNYRPTSEDALFTSSGGTPTATATVSTAIVDTSTSDTASGTLAP